MAKKMILSIQVVNGVKITQLAPSQPKKKPLTVAIPARSTGNFITGAYRSVKMY
ncbi:MAG: hypothetical protein Q8Q10_03110 [bacterium]|nr:hypothetical protein [bacterium]